jgi:hypothetical protein
MAPVDGRNSSRVLLKTGGNPQSLLIHLSCVAFPCAPKHNVSGQLFSLGGLSDSNRKSMAGCFSDPEASA